MGEQVNSDKIICPHCKNPIYDEDALSCLYCGGSLKRAVGLFGKIRYPTPKIIIVIAVSLILVSFVMFIIR